MNLILSIFNASVKYAGEGILVFVSSTACSTNYCGLGTAVGCSFHLCP